MAIKARSAIGLAGHDADTVTWLDDRGTWATSSAYANGKAGWVSTFITANPIERDAGKTWDRTLPAARYEGPDDAPGEGRSNGWSTTFPHPLGVAGDRAFYAHWMMSPFADEYLEQMAEAAIDENHLGQQDTTDFLGVSFSTFDMIGHTFGPRSHEIQDELVRLDRTLGRLLDRLDEKVGAGNYVVALSADHGVAEIPDQVPGGGRVVGSVLSGAIDAVLKGAGYGDGELVAATAGSDVYLKTGVYDRLRTDAKTRRALLDTMAKLSGVARVVTADDVNTAAARQSRDPQIKAVALSYFPGRSGDLIVIPKPNWIMGTSVTTHGTLNAYDRQVPVIFYGAGIRRGVRTESASPADIAPTLGSMVGVRLDPVDGKILSGALKK
jgi:predicted AlkP superfamily pyrophosphatase or phosphodiesterase